MSFKLWIDDFTFLRYLEEMHFVVYKILLTVCGENPRYFRLMYSFYTSFPDYDLLSIGPLRINTHWLIFLGNNICNSLVRNTFPWAKGVKSIQDPRAVRFLSHTICKNRFHFAD